MANINVNGSLEFNSITGNGLSAILDKVYPVGSIYMSLVDESPAGFLEGGTWEKIRGRFLLGESDTISVGSTGGEATHTLTIDEMPAHRHYTRSFEMTASGSEYSSSWINWDSLEGAETSTVGGSQPHNNMPPYLAVYMWKRTE